MRDIWNKSSELRIKEWRSFRESLDLLSFEDVLKSVLNFWSFAPFVNNYFKIKDKSSIPNPWELLDENKYDDFGKILGMFYTLVLTNNHSAHKYSIQIVKFSELDESVILRIDDDYVLGYEFDKIVAFQDLPDHKVCSTFNEENLEIYKLR